MDKSGKTGLEGYFHLKIIGPRLVNYGFGKVPFFQVLGKKGQNKIRTVFHVLTKKCKKTKKMKKNEKKCSKIYKTEKSGFLVKITPYAVLYPFFGGFWGKGPKWPKMAKMAKIAKFKNAKNAKNAKNGKNGYF